MRTGIEVRRFTRLSGGAPGRFESASNGLPLIGGIPSDPLDNGIPLGIPPGILVDMPLGVPPRMLVGMPVPFPPVAGGTPGRLPKMLTKPPGSLRRCGSRPAYSRMNTGSRPARICCVEMPSEPTSQRCVHVNMYRLDVKGPWDGFSQ